MVEEPTPDMEVRDPEMLSRWLPRVNFLVRRYHRTEIRGEEHIPSSSCLMVSNHSGGAVPMDVPIIANAIFERHGADCPFYTLGHDLIFTGPAGKLLKQMGLVPASQSNAADILAAGGIVLVFPGGDHDVFRPTSERNTINFDGRTGYVRTALKAGVSIQPVVSIGGHENQLFLSRGQALGRRMPYKKVIRTDLFPVGVGAPFGLGPVGFPLPTKIVTRFLPSIDPGRESDGPEVDIAAVDEKVRAVMQAAMDELAAARRWPVIG